MALMVVAATKRELAAALGPAGNGLPMDGPGEPRVFAGRKIVPLATGIGVINAAYALGLGLERVKPSGVVGVGIAGAFDLDVLPLGSACLVGREVWPEYGVEDGKLADAGALRFPLAEAGGVVIRQAIGLDPEARVRELGLAPPRDCPVVSSVTVSAVTTSPERVCLLADGHGADIENMEGFAWALACFRAGAPFVQVRAVSNRVGERDKGRWAVRRAFSSLGRCLKTLMEPRLSPGEKKR